MAQLFALRAFGRLCLQGTKALDLLHGQCSGEVRQLQIADHLFTSVNNIKGRCIATFLLWRAAEDRFYLEAPTSNLPALQALLSKYAPLYRCQVSLDDSHQCYLSQDPSLTGAHSLTYPSGNRRLWLETPRPDAIELDRAWLSDDLQQGWVFLTSAQSEQYLPQQLGLDRNGGISFTKGCYTGQEVIARLHYRGKSKQLATFAQHQGSQPDTLESTSTTYGDLIAHHLQPGVSAAMWLQRSEQQGQLPPGWQLMTPESI